MKAAATVLDVQAVRVTFALEAEEWLVEQFAELGYGKAFLKRYLEQPFDRMATGDKSPAFIFDRPLTGEERDRLTKYLREVRKVRSPGSAPMDRMDGKPRNVLGRPAQLPSHPTILPMPTQPLPPNVGRGE